MSRDATFAFLHAHGLEVRPQGLDEAVVAALDAMAVVYAPSTSEALTVAECEVAAYGGLDPTPGGEDPLVEGVASYAALLRSGLTTAAAAARLGVSDARVRQRLADRSLFAVRQGPAWRLPLFQFGPDGELPGWGLVCAALPEGLSPVALERWLRTRHPDLGEAPREALLAGRDPRLVAAAAAELA